MIRTRALVIAVALAALATAALAAGVGAAGVDAQTDGGGGGSSPAATGRLAGATRIDTAVAIAQRAFPDGAVAAYLANADEPVDAVAGGSLTDGPVLLVPHCALPDAVRQELARLAPQEVLALGGAAAVCDEVLHAAAAAADEEDTVPDAGLMYTCGGVPFDPEAVFSQTTPAETKEGDVYDALRHHIAEGTGFGEYPDGPWYELGEVGERTEFLARYDDAPPEGAIGVVMQLEQAAGGWEWAGAGGCRPMAHQAPFGPATWALDGADPAPPDTTFTAHVTEVACASGQSSEGRVQEPVVTYLEDVIIVTFFVEPLEGVQDCPGNPPTPVEVQLEEPVGDRQLLDGGVWPPRLPVEGA